MTFPSCFSGPSVTSPSCRRSDVAGPQTHGSQQGGRSAGRSCLPALRLVTFAVFAERLRDRTSHGANLLPQLWLLNPGLTGCFVSFFLFKSRPDSPQPRIRIPAGLRPVATGFFRGTHTCTQPGSPREQCSHTLCPAS